MQIKDVADGRIEISPLKWKRTARAENVADLAESVARLGVLQPAIGRRASGGRIELLAGGHRLKAARQAGLKSIPVSIIAPEDDAEAEVISLETDLKTFRPTSDEWEMALNRWRHLFERKHGPSKAGRQKKKGTPRPSFIKAAARLTGKTPRHIRRALARQRKLIPEAMKARSDGRLADSGADELVKVPANQQQELLPQLIGKKRDDVRKIVGAHNSAPTGEAGLKLTHILKEACKAARVLDEDLKTARRLAKQLGVKGAALEKVAGTEGRSSLEKLATTVVCVLRRMGATRQEA